MGGALQFELDAIDVSPGQSRHVLILDEPTNHLDLESVEALVEGVKAFKGGVVMVSHDARLVIESECDVMVCEGASSVSDGGTGTCPPPPPYTASLKRSILIVLFLR